MARILIGVSGGIGAYKAVEVARGLQKRGHDVVVIMTAAATRFVGPITFEAITRRRVASAIAGLPDSARLTVGWLTPARSATSKDVGRLLDPPFMRQASRAQAYRRARLACIAIRTGFVCEGLANQTERADCER